MLRAPLPVPIIDAGPAAGVPCFFPFSLPSCNGSVTATPAPITHKPKPSQPGSHGAAPHPAGGRRYWVARRAGTDDAGHLPARSAHTRWAPRAATDNACAAAKAWRRPLISMRPCWPRPQPNFLLWPGTLTLHWLRAPRPACMPFAPLSCTRPTRCAVAGSCHLRGVPPSIPSLLFVPGPQTPPTLGPDQGPVL
jgi:hypothetical protein